MMIHLWHCHRGQSNYQRRSSLPCTGRQMWYPLPWQGPPMRQAQGLQKLLLESSSYLTSVFLNAQATLPVVFVAIVFQANPYCKLNCFTLITSIFILFIQENIKGPLIPSESALGIIQDFIFLELHRLSERSGYCTFTP